MNVLLGVNVRGSQFWLSSSNGASRTGFHCCQSVWLPIPLKGCWLCDKQASHSWFKSHLLHKRPCVNFCHSEWLVISHQGMYPPSRSNDLNWLNATRPPYPKALSRACVCAWKTCCWSSFLGWNHSGSRSPSRRYRNNITFNLLLKILRWPCMLSNEHKG